MDRQAERPSYRFAIRNYQGHLHWPIAAISTECSWIFLNLLNFAVIEKRLTDGQTQRQSLKELLFSTKKLVVKGLDQSHKGFKWSAVPLPCSTFVLNEFFLCFLGGEQGSGPKRGGRPVEWGDFSCLSVHPSINSSVYSEPWLAGWLAGPRPSWLGLRPSWPLTKNRN